MTNGHGLGRRIPMDFDHVSRARLLSIQPAQAIAVEKFLDLPNPTKYRVFYDQGHEGACVGFSSSWMLSILNRKRYDATRLYQEAQLVDGFADTPPADGTSVKAAMDVLIARGAWPWFAGLGRLLRLSDGVSSVRWGTTVDELRVAISQGIPFVLGINWYQNFDSPVFKDGWHIGDTGGDSDWGAIRGGHAICGYAASDRRQAFRLINTWGMDYPPVWIPYTAIQRLLNEDGEAAIVTDRVEYLKAA